MGLRVRLTTVLALMFAPALILGLGLALRPAPVAAASNPVLTAAPWLVSVTGSGPSDGRDYHCSGSVIADHWVLSAAHCADEDAGGALGARLVETRVVVGGHAVAAVEYPMSGRPLVLAQDLMLVWTSTSLRSLGARPIALAGPDFVAPTGAPVAFYGTGQLGDGRDGPHATTAGAYVQTPGCAAGPELVCFAPTGAAPSDAGVRLGDSGGPWVGVDGAGRPVEIALQSGYLGTDAAAGPDFGPRVNSPANRAWILEVMRLGSPSVASVSLDSPSA